MNAIKNLIEKLCDLVMHGRFSDETEVITNTVSEVMPVVATEEPVSYTHLLLNWISLG